MQSLTLPPDGRPGSWFRIHTTAQISTGDTLQMAIQVVGCFEAHVQSLESYERKKLYQQLVCRPLRPRALLLEDVVGTRHADVAGGRAGWAPSCTLFSLVPSYRRAG